MRCQVRCIGHANILPVNFFHAASCSGVMIGFTPGSKNSVRASKTMLSYLQPMSLGNVSSTEPFFRGVQWKIGNIDVRSHIMPKLLTAKMVTFTLGNLMGGASWAKMCPDSTFSFAMITLEHNKIPLVTVISLFVCLLLTPQNCLF